MTYRQRFKSADERFDEKVDRSGGPDACWPWTAGRHTFGYGLFWNEGKTVGAHIYALERESGPLPDGQWALHRCDNPPCCNPRHLFAGTAKANTADMLTKGRANTPRGERNGHSRLTAAQIAEIRAAAGTTPQRALAGRYGVTQSHISRVVSRDVWRELAEERAKNGSRR